MDRYLLLVIWGEAKVPSAAPSAAGGQVDHGPGDSSVEGAEKQPGKRRAEKEREPLSGRGRNLSLRSSSAGEGGWTISNCPENLRLHEIGPIRAEKCHYLRGEIGTRLWMHNPSAQKFLAQ